MKRVLITSVLMVAFGFGTASEVQAQIVYGYSSSANDGGVMSPPASMNYGSYQGYSQYAAAYNRGVIRAATAIRLYRFTSMSPRTRPWAQLPPLARSQVWFLDLWNGFGIWRIVFGNADGHEPHVQPL